MALVKPIVNEIVAFDAMKGTTIKFTASGGDQVTGNTIKVVSNEYIQGYYRSANHLFYEDSSYTVPLIGKMSVLYVDIPTNKNYVYNGTIFVESSSSEIVIYQNHITSYELSNNIPANVLINGRYYKVAIQTNDVLGNTSPWSSYQPFYCYQTPTLTFNILNGQTLNVANYRFVMTYNQAQNEKVDYGLIEVYNNNNILIGTSNNIYDTGFPPLEFVYDIFGLENHSQFYVVGTVVTVNGTIVKTNKIRFYTNYDTVIDPNRLTVTLDSCNGYVNLHSNFIGNIEGIAHPDPLPYLKNNTMVDIRNATADLNIPEYAHWVKFATKEILIVPTNFLLRMWFYPARQPFEIIRLTNDDGSCYLKINFRRDSTTDYLSIRTDNGTVKDVPLGMLCNGNTKVFLWINIIGNTWDVQFQILETTATIMNWGDSSNNIPYNVTADFTYIGESFETFTPSADNFEPISEEFTNIIIGNGVFDHLNISTDTSLTYSTVIPEWEDTDVINIKFNGDLKNGAPHYTKLVLKRKDETTLNWINLSEVNIGYNEPTFIDFDDSFIPTGVEQEYALVVYIDNVPSEFHTEKITPIWGKYFLSDKTNKFVLNYAVIYSGQVQNVQNGVFMPIGATYPIVIQNGEGNYTSGSLQFKVVGYQYEIDKRLDRVSITKQKNDLLKFLTNGKAKCLTDFNGNIYILKVINSPQISYDANWGNGIPTISFDWVEQAKYNDYDSMIELGLFDYIATE